MADSDNRQSRVAKYVTKLLNLSDLELAASSPSTVAIVVRGSSCISISISKHENIEKSVMEVEG